MDLIPNMHGFKIRGGPVMVVYLMKGDSLV